MTAALPDLSFHPAWHAQLELAYARAGDATRPVTRRHSGPLRVQKHLYAEGPEVCQHILVHPPGGIAGGDSLAFDVRLGERAWAQLTSPGAAKWYRAACPSRQTLEIASPGIRCWRPWSPAARSTPTCCNAAARSPAPAAATSASCPAACWWRAAWPTRRCTRVPG